MKGLVKVNLVVIVNGLVRVKRIVRGKGVVYVGSGGYCERVGSGGRGGKGERCC